MDCVWNSRGFLQTAPQMAYALKALDFSTCKIPTRQQQLLFCEMPDASLLRETCCSMPSTQMQGSDCNLSCMSFKGLTGAWCRSKEITITRLESCGTCNGSGQKEGTTPTTCSTCGGQGQVAQVMQSILGRIQQVRFCPSSSKTSRPVGTAVILDAARA